MTIKTRLRNLLESLLGARIVKRLPRGVFLPEDIASFLPGLKIRTVLDIGANVGQSARGYARDFPNAEIYSFEPVTASYEALCRNTSDEPRIHPVRQGFGSEKGTLRMLAQSTRSDNRMVGEAEVVDEKDVEEVPVGCFDDYANEHNLLPVNFLKIDTEGMDLDVLRGASESLAADAVDVIQVEAGVNQDNSRHRSLHEFAEFLDQFEYRLFGIYEQTQNWRHGHPHLRRVNAVYISNSLARREISSNREP